MASAPSVTAIVSDSTEKSFSKETSQQQNGESHLAEPANSANSASFTVKSLSENHAPANGTSQDPASETKQEQNNTGEKRNLETTSSEQTNAEPFSKKLKTNEDDSDAINGASAPAPSGQTEPSQTTPAKKNGGRPRKIKDTVTAKKAIPTDGIGSRTRSRTKVVS
ncbi:hypothetical protein BDV06DRAFT_226225 [Aspergillus oleicola]